MEVFRKRRIRLAATTGHEVGIPWVFKVDGRVAKRKGDREESGRNIEKTRFGNMAYADDTAIMGQEKEVLEAEDILIRTITNFDGKVNQGKTEGLRVSATTTDHLCEDLGEGYTIKHVGAVLSDRAGASCSRNSDIGQGPKMRMDGNTKEQVFWLMVPHLIFGICLLADPLPPFYPPFYPLSGFGFLWCPCSVGVCLIRPPRSESGSIGSAPRCTRIPTGRKVLARLVCLPICSSRRVLPCHVFDSLPSWLGRVDHFRFSGLYLYIATFLVGFVPLLPMLNDTFSFARVTIKFASVFPYL